MTAQPANSASVPAASRRASAGLARNQPASARPVIAAPPVPGASAQTFTQFGAWSHHLISAWPLAACMSTRIRSLVKVLLMSGEPL